MCHTPRSLEHGKSAVRLDKLTMFLTDEYQAETAADDLDVRLIYMWPTSSQRLLSGIDWKSDQNLV
jgi:hypothetical protein